MARKRKPTQAVRQFRRSSLFDWEAEPVDERPRESVPASRHCGLSAFATLDGFGTRRSRRSGGFGTLLLALTLFLALGVAGLLGMVHLLHR